MLLDVASQYDEVKTKYLREIREKIVLQLAGKFDHKKILSFLNKAGVVSIEDKEKCVYIWVPNEFVMSQVKKFFFKAIKEAVHVVYNPQYTAKIVVYVWFQKNNDLLLDLKKILKIQAKPKATATATINKSIKDELSSYFGILFDPMFKFDSFISGSNSKFAFAASKAVAENPGKVYNPLFLYGNVWLGKTHLMQAIGNEIILTHPEKVVLYLPTVKLVDEIVSGIRNDKFKKLQQKLDNVDVLLLDDIQFLAWAEKTQEVFHHIFNDFYMKKKQIILSSDRPPKELVNITSRLRSRFGIGLVADIQAPDYETRIAILQAKMEQKNGDIEFEHLATIAKYIKNNVRELEWALNLLITRQKMIGQELWDEDVTSCLKTLWYVTSSTSTITEQAIQSNTKSLQNFGNLVGMVAQYYNIAVSDLKSDSRRKEITMARQILMILAKEKFGRTLAKTWDYFGWKNHASVIYAINNVKKKLKSDDGVAHDYQVFVDWLEG